jgi:glycosyltransferase involved in cell wall biosynthesis
MQYDVDILMPTYNHEKFLAEAIEGVVSQRTQYRFRLIVGEDCSKDNTRSILRKYAASYPEIVLPVYFEKNVGSTANAAYLNTLINARYVAVCEGDDYWTHPDKLQMQIEFLDNNPDFTIAFTDVAVIDGEGKKLNRDDFKPVLTKDVFTIEDFIISAKNIIPTVTILYRNILPKDLPDFHKRAVSGDLALQLQLADKGKAKYFPLVTAVYRNHGGGISKAPEQVATGHLRTLQLYEEANEFFNHKYNTVIRKRLKHASKVNIVYYSQYLHGIAKLRYVFRHFPTYLRYQDGINWKETAIVLGTIFFPNLLRNFSKTTASN